MRRSLEVQRVADQKTTEEPGTPGFPKKQPIQKQRKGPETRSETTTSQEGGAESGGLEDDRRTGNSGVPEEAADPETKERTGDTLGDRHVPGGAWLRKAERFIQFTTAVIHEPRDAD
ncbi:hypothetical protein NDU88_003169 [Pleurodeles waltl]|uniref:Uncharacterized protein n=1 Tax=Pleurodeles waltl TaxID=8319 RepID=A0AAV7PCB1_PLEWA|nr:hypothetical protein NDU88_003169 [Pleurodeles waltl]